MSRRTKTRRPRRGLQIFLSVIVALVIIFILLAVFVAGPLKEKASGYLAEQLIQSQISSDDNPVGDIDTDKIMNTIINNHMSPQAVKDAASYLKNGDREGLKNYARENLTEEEMGEVKELYIKYKDEILQQMQQ